MTALICTIAFVQSLFYYQSVESLYAVRQKPAILHLDIEPQALSNWWTDVLDISEDYLELIDKINNKLTTENSPLKPRMVMPFWWDSDTRVCPCIGTPSVCKQLADFVLDKVDHVLVMSYRDSASLIQSFAAGELTYADTLSNKQVTVAVETLCGVGDAVTFCEEGTTDLETALTTSLSVFEAYNSFETYAIHHYASYKILTPSYTISASVCDGKYRGLYVWERDITSASLSDRTDLLTFCNDHCIDTIYLDAYRLISLGTSATYKENYAKFIDLAYGYGVKIEYLLGDPSWALAANHNTALGFFQDIIDFHDDLVLFPDAEGDFATYQARVCDPNIVAP